MRNLLLDRKKGQVSSLAPAILALVFAGVVLVFGIVMAQSLTDTQKGTETGPTVTNESVAIITGKGAISTATTNLCGYETWTDVLVMNCTTGPACPNPINNTLTRVTDYNIYPNGSIYNVTYVKTPLKVTYTYTYGGEACEAGNLTVVGLGAFADFWEIIVLAIVISVVIGLLLVIFGGKQRR